MVEGQRIKVREVTNFERKFELLGRLPWELGDSIIKQKN